MSKSESRSRTDISNQRIAGVTLPHKRMCIALTYIHGIGRTTAVNICKKCKIDPNIRPSELVEKQLIELRNYISKNLTTEGDLRKETRDNIRFLIDIGSYRGLRHKLGLPCRGQRTKTNARTRKGKVKTIANKKKPTK